MTGAVLRPASKSEKEAGPGAKAVTPVFFL